MIYKKKKTSRFKRPPLATAICLLLIISIVFILYKSKDYLSSHLKINIPSNLLYLQLLNHSMPIIKASTLDAEVLSDTEGNLGKQLLKFVDLTIDDTANLLKGEVILKEPGNSDSSNTENVEDIRGVEEGSDIKGTEGAEGPQAVEDGEDIESIENTEGLEDTDLPPEEGKIIPFDLRETMVKRKVEPPAAQDKPNSSESPKGKEPNVVDPSIKKALNKSKPEVLIYHTHTTESFSPNGNYTTEPSKNITSVGNIITNELEKAYGISVAHDTTIHNVSMIKPYERSAKTVSKYLEQYNSFKLIIDLHRDGGTSKATTTTNINNQSLAKIMFVVANTSPYLKTNQQTVTKLQNLSDKLFPGFCRDVTVYKKAGHYNQDKAPNTVLIEVGSEKNTLEEAQNSAKYIARIIAEYINGK
jgi:stage II sporulation protein P